MAEELHAVREEIARRAELTLLVVLAVLRQIALGHDAEDPAAVDHDRRVEEAVLDPQRHADDDHGTQASALPHHGFERVARRGAKRALVKEVLVRVGRQAQLGEDHERRVGVGGLARERQRPLRVELGLGRPRARHRRADAHHRDQRARSGGTDGLGQRRGRAREPIRTSGKQGRHTHHGIDHHGDRQSDRDRPGDRAFGIPEEIGEKGPESRKTGGPAIAPPAGQKDCRRQGTRNERHARSVNIGH